MKKSGIYETVDENTNPNSSRGWYFFVDINQKLYYINGIVTNNEMSRMYRGYIKGNIEVMEV